MIFYEKGVTFCTAKFFPSVLQNEAVTSRIFTETRLKLFFKIPRAWILKKWPYQNEKANRVRTVGGL